MALPNLKPDAALPSAFDDRSSSEAAIDMAAASVYGALLAAEAEFDGHMSFSVEILSRVIERYMEEVREASSEDVAEIYAQKLRDAAA